MSLLVDGLAAAPAARFGAGLLRLCGHLLSPGGRRGRLATLIFHRVLREPDPLLPDEPDAVTFRRLMETVAEHFNVLPLREAVARLARHDLPARAACITFDDGYADNATVAAPILSELGLPATVFVASGFLDGGRMFNDTAIELVRRADGPLLDASSVGLGEMPLDTQTARMRCVAELQMALKYLPPAQRAEPLQALCEKARATLPDDLMMTREQVRGLAASGMEVGAHTRLHPILASLDACAAREEMGTSREELAAITGVQPALFAYPNGKPGRDYTAAHVAMAEELGFEAAVSTVPGVAHARSDRFQLPRFTPWERAPRRFVLRLLHNHLNTRAEVA